MAEVLCSRCRRVLPLTWDPPPGEPEPLVVCAGCVTREELAAMEDDAEGSPADTA